MEQGGVEEVRELLRAHGEEAIFAECERAGLKPLRRRFRCPLPACAHKSGRGRDAGWFAAEHSIFRWKCHSCEGGGTLVDLLMATHGLDVAGAIALLRGQAAPAPKPRLHVVPPPAPDPDKLSAAEVKRLWDALAGDDELAQEYLDARGLEGGKFVRFATEKHPDKAVKKLAKGQRRIAMLLTDVVGNPRSIQFRLVREPLAKEPKILSLAGASTAGGFFGQPELVEASPLVCVTEGMADTLAVLQWNELKAPVVGAPGKSSLPRLAEELGRAGIQLAGKVFCLFAQNDRPKNESRREFVRLSQLLAQAGAHPILIATPDEWKDTAEWRKARPEVPWPPPELAKVLGDQVEHDTPATELVRPEGSAIAVPKMFTSDRYGQDFSTCLALLDDPVHREAIMGRGELQLSEMTERPLYNGREVTPADILAVRYGLERHGRSLEGKPLKFGNEEVRQALYLLASRHRVHPVREWLSSLKWDRKERISVSLPQVMGLEPMSLDAHLLRKWFIATVARPMRPGCKQDCMLVLLGAQGLKKSSFFEAIGGKWFTDEAIRLDDKDGKMVLRTSWIVEWAELESMRKARDVEEVKRFLSQRVDKFRPPYGHDIIEAPRGCIMVGTNNPAEFLTDPTGNRRIWPVTVKEIDLGWVREHREQLLAEAVALFRGDEQWWLEEAYSEALFERHREHEVEDPWLALVHTYWREHPHWIETTVSDVLDGIIKKPAGQWTGYDLARAGKVLSALGWHQQRKRVEGSSVRPRVWLPPEGGLP